MTFLPILYDKAKTDKIKCWQIGTRANVIVTQHGYIDGAITESTKTIYKGKNIGKKNETTPEQQAFREAMSKWQKQKDKGYVEDINDIGKITTYHPMLAKTYTEKTKLPNLVCVQPKLNGVRCIAVKKDNCVKLYSRYMKDYTKVCWNLAKDLNHIMASGDIFDGEIYIHGMNFQRITSAVKKENEDTHRLQFWVYDYPSETDSFTKRHKSLEAKYFNLNNNSDKCIFVDTCLHVKGQHNIIQNYHDKYVIHGYEGLIIRDPNAKYIWKHRGKELLKYKEMVTDEEFRIIGYTSGSGNDEGAIIFRCHVGGSRDKGRRGYFNVRPVGTIDHRKSMYRNGWTYVGQMLTVQYQERSVDNVPTFPVGTAIRNYE